MLAANRSHSITVAFRGTLNVPPIALRTPYPSFLWPVEHEANQRMAKKVARVSHTTVFFQQWVWLLGQG